MDFSVLGALRVTDGGRAVEIGGPRQRRLLAALIAHAGEIVPTDRLIEIVFEQEPPEGAANTIRTYVARLRRSLAEARPGAAEVIVTQPPGYGFSTAGNTVDASSFAERVAAGVDQVDRDPVGAAATLEDALAMWRGPAFGEFVYEDWARAEIDRLEELRAIARENLIEARLACGLHDEVVPELRQIVREHPLREKPWRLLVIALYRSGRQAEALRAADELRAKLVEVGLEPSGALVALERSVAAHDPALHLAQPAGRPLRGYRLGELIGQGAHGVVYRGTQPGIGREVAVKAIKSKLIDRPEFVRRFDVEAQMVAHLEHPHIVPLYDYWREPGGAYMVMRRLHRNLADELGRGPLDTRRVATLAGQLGSALASAHRAGVVHGDLKPSNVLLDGEGNAYLSDFGVATLLGQEDDAVPSPTSGYRSPEVVDGHPPRPASDQFALAVLLTQALTGTLAFGAAGITGPNDRIRSIHAARPAVPATVDDVIRRATSWAPADRYGDVAGFVDGLTVAIEGGREVARVAVTAVNPYKGLRPFDEANAPFFFGRERLVAEVIDRLDGGDSTSRLVTVVGASGSGKSSIVRAGLIPRLRSGAVSGSDRWLVATMVPGPDPFAALAAGLLPIAAEVPVTPTEGDPDGWFGEIVGSAVPAEQPVLLVLDQMEELFTLTDPATRTAFLTGLTATLGGSSPDLRVVATLRADFYDRPLQTPMLGELVKESGVTVVGMSAAELHEAIVDPAGRAGVEVEPVLATQLASEVIRRPAALPLLQFTLHELYRNRSGCIIDLASYQEMGRIETAIARHAEAVHAALPEADRGRVRSTFLKLITVSQEGAPTRRRVLRRELAAGDTDVVDAFAAARLLTVDADPATREPTVELSHEALITHWPRLRTWVDEAGEDLVTWSKLDEASAEWASRGRDLSDLYRGARLVAALAWAARHPEDVGELESAFLTAGAGLRDAEEEERQAQLTRERRDNRRLRRVLAGLAAALLVAVAAGFVAVDQRNQARRDKASATVQSLVTASSANLETDAQLSLQLAVAASAAALEASLDLPIVGQALHDALAADRELFNVPNTENGLAHFSTDGEWFVAASAPGDPSVVQLWDADTLEPVTDFRGHDDAVFDAVFSPDGTLVATASADGTVGVWDVASAERLHVLAVDDATPVVPAFSHDGRIVATSTLEGVAWLWDVRSGAHLRTLRWPDLPEERPGLAGLNLAFSPDDSLLALIHQWASTPDVLVWNLETGEPHTTMDKPSAKALDVAFSTDGTMVITGGEGGVDLWDAASGEHVAALTDPDVVSVRDIQVSADGRALAAGGVGDTLVWDLRSRDVRHRLRGHSGEVDGIDLSPDGQLLLTGSFVDGTTRLWDLGPARGSWLLSLERAPEPLSGSGAAYHPDGTQVAGTKSVSSVAVWDATTGAQVDEFETDVSSAVILDYGPDGSLLGVGGWEGAMIRDLGAGRSTVLFRDDPSFPTPVAISFDPDGETVATASSRGIEIWPVTGGDPRLVVARPSWVVSHSPDGSMIAVVGEEDPATSAGVIEVYDATTYEPLVAIPTGFNQGTPHIMDVTRLTFTGDGTRMVAVGWDGTVVVWDTGTWEPLLELSASEDSIVGVAVDPQDRTVATAGFDGSARIWDLVTGSLQLELVGDAALTDVAFSPDGGRLVVAGDSGPTRIHPVELTQVLDLARTRLTRQLTPTECIQYGVADCPAPKGT